ncbi:DUF29 domain-containing protein [Azospirillum doebereinerae]|uniref:DUF29 domain-containing protein n=1 Tax=Azospirillum doebereinerae TaxID=92933 RepID=A0A3S1CGX8_9PROT|nr:DUF29 domain-containing protein [Azospirillum doebereinerae]MCG5239835.1 DUF29 domain-containing protein [Azospirillum doebereinerae]RUQ70733.1 DUF29 domain-containing protein [Azospirillum doebereinerae]
MDSRIGYDTDFLAWTEEQARLLREASRERINTPIDWENVAEEIESMGRSQLRAVESALVRAIEHLLKLEHSPAADLRGGWRRLVREQRDQANDALADSPSLRGKLDFAKAYRRGRDYAIDGLEQDRTAVELSLTDGPYTLDQVLDPDWWPVNRHGLS